MEKAAMDELTKERVKGKKLGRIKEREKKGVHKKIPFSSEQLASERIKRKKGREKVNEREEASRARGSAEKATLKEPRGKKIREVGGDTYFT